MSGAKRERFATWPPDRLPTIGVRGVGIVRAAWLTLMALVLAVQLVGIAYVLFDAYRATPALAAIGLRDQFDDDDRLLTNPIRADALAAGIHPGARIIAVGDRSLGIDATALEIGRAVIATPGPRVRLRVRNADGGIVDATLTRGAKAPLLNPANPIPLDVRMLIRLSFTLLCSLSLLGSTTVLFLRRPHDPEAMLIAFAFLGIAATVDPPLIMWLGIGAGTLMGWVTSAWWVLLFVAIAAFPDGRFQPRWLRWTIPAAPVLGVILAQDDLSDILSLLFGIVFPLIVLAMQVRRYRRLPVGLERQQIKWAAYGFAIGFVLVGVALGIVDLVDIGDPGWSPMAKALWPLAVICIFNLAFAIMPLGLIVSLLKYRLWDVDALISRSAAYAVLTGLIGLTWAASADFLKAAIGWALGNDHNVIALAIGPILAASLFAPTQRVVLRWSKRLFQRDRLAIDDLPKRLDWWSENCDPPGLAMRVLDVVIPGAHAEGGAILLRTSTGRTLLAATNVDRAAELTALTIAQLPDDPRVARIVELTDEDGTIGWLILAPRSDGAPYSRGDIASLDRVAPPLAGALRTANGRSAGAMVPQSLLEEVQARLAKLEQDRPSLA